LIFGVGVDLVRISRIEAALERFGERFPRRILADAEYWRYRESPRQADFLARHFAAKEAFVKALGTGLRLGIGWRQIEVCRDHRGRPYLVCRGRARELMHELGAGESHLSLCDEAEYALAHVTLLRAGRESS